MIGPDRQRDLPGRWSSLSPLKFTLLVVALAIILASISQVAPSGERLADGLPRMFRLIGRMAPPEMDPAFLGRVGLRLLETFQIAFAGTVIGIILSMPLAWLSARRISPLGAFRTLPGMVISLFRTVPDLIWALLFVSAVGLGAVAGTMTIIVDTIGFCGRFFAEAMEDADRQPQEALDAMGAPRVGILLGAVIPDAMPSFINTALFALEKAIRSSVVLGLVGAGGIGQELKSAFDLFQYPKAATIIIAIFIVVLAMERLTDTLRQRVS